MCEGCLSIKLTFPDGQDFEKNNLSGGHFCYWIPEDFPLSEQGE